MQISPHRDVDMWGRIWMSCFNSAWQSLNFDKRISLWFWDFSLCNFRDFIYTQSACNTPKRKRNLKFHHMTPRMSFCPTEMVKGWWWVKEPEELTAILSALHPRGIREKVLHKHLTKHMEHMCEVCTRPITGEEQQHIQSDCRLCLMAACLVRCFPSFPPRSHLPDDGGGRPCPAGGV